MGRRGKRHIVDPFHSYATLCGRHRKDVDPDGRDPCRRCITRLEVLRGVMRTGKSSRVFEMPCSTCGAPAGMPCLSVSGRPHGGHMARHQLQRALNAPKGEAWERETARARKELTLVLDWRLVRDARSSDRPSAPPAGEGALPGATDG